MAFRLRIAAGGSSYLAAQTAMRLRWSSEPNYLRTCTCGFVLPLSSCLVAVYVTGGVAAPSSLSEARGDALLAIACCAIVAAPLCGVLTDSRRSSLLALAGGVAGFVVSSVLLAALTSGTQSDALVLV